ncbi:phage integrase SAM-like domain-containing protein [Metabacillus halosaccharovorans]|uniref:phage integrase SAM-like domain-containing protein n=1 Tax=Metabacillus halosaccharovorans TaxID=930124 RepID=UPI001C20117C|nr:phage integrase SAM-like domain-containing protein [Metabacillus halosaccharovorans]MBU7593238.1 hypothetical protein [Metabacillus halosaccharovorans]
MKRKRMTVRVKTDKTKEDNSFNFTFQQAFEYFISDKKSEGLRKSTIKSHYEHFHFFLGWLDYNYPEITKVNDLDTSLIGEYINYMRDDHYNYKTKDYGLATQTINARIRFLKTFYNCIV